MIALPKAAVRDRLFLDLSLAVYGAFAEFIPAEKWLAGLRSNRDRYFPQHRSISKGAS